MTTLLSAAASANSGAMTTLAMILIVMGAVYALALIWWGTMQRRAKAHEVADAEKHAVLAGHAPEAAPGAEVLDEAEAVSPPLVKPLVDAPVVAAAPLPADSGSSQPLTLLKGLGPKAAARLGELGITSVDQLAALSPGQIADIDAQMGSFAGRISRDRWIEQAKLLAAGDVASFEAAFGKLGS
ncbi:hypothetical protein [Sphingomonas sp. 28-62-11]|uniref:hypothetical protein n=1 Tax=Sphingomonas sp. 28-62-11 TaxID=1970432 RepID=UPI000BCC9784|nr:MAG: hypothetical protein B7Y49_01660 [Sphingomonas sp. 28-62-11]